MRNNRLSKLLPFQQHQQRIFGLTHKYSKLTGWIFYAVATSLTLEELNLACAYLQFLRDDLPDLVGVEDTIGESEGIKLLEQVYNCQPLVSHQPISAEAEIDFYDNWNNYSGANYKKVNKLARPKARERIIHNLLEQAISGYLICRSDDYRRTIELLSTIASGFEIPESWNLKTCSGQSYSGKILLNNKVDFL